MHDEEPGEGAKDPSTQEVQLVCPGFADIWPAGQGVQGTTEVFENVPAVQAVAQLVDDVEPGGEDFPAGHDAHVLEFEISLTNALDNAYFPIGQETDPEHALVNKPVALPYVPAGQFMHAVPPVE